MKLPTKKTKLAFVRVFDNEDGRLVMDDFKEYYNDFINAAIFAQHGSEQLKQINRASGVDGVIWRINRMVEAGKKTTEEEGEDEENGD